MQNKELCPFCQEKFDRIRHAPRDIGCGSHHLVCTECLSDCINSYDKKILCILHDGQDKMINLKNKVLADFPIKEFNKTKEDQAFCTQHGNMSQVTASFICMECAARMCLSCSQDHMKAGHSIVSTAEITSKKKEIEDDIKNKLQIIEEARFNREKRYEATKTQVEKSLKDEADKCLREFQSQIDLIKSNTSAYLINVNKACHTELVLIDNEFSQWRHTVLEKVKRLSKENDPELALRGLFKEQKELRHNAKMGEYEEKITKQIDVFQKEMKKVSINFFQRFSKFIKKELFTELKSLGNHQQEEKEVRFSMENGYKAFKKDEGNYFFLKHKL